MRSLWQDMRFAGRMLRKSPGFTAIALITLAIGIGANTIMFSMVNVLLLRPAQVRGLDELALCKMGDISYGTLPYSAYVDMRNDNPAFSDLMAHDPGLKFVTLAREDIARRAFTMFVSANYFSFLGVAPRLPILSAMTLTDSHGNNPFVWLAGMGARLAVGFGVMALFLASLGIYAVKGYMVASRTSKIGIRKALGATHGNIMGTILWEGMVLTLAGLMVGLLLGLAAARLIGSLLYGVSPVDPVSIVVTVALLGAASLLASYVPARRAARIDPMVALRCE